MRSKYSITQLCRFLKLPNHKFGDLKQDILEALEIEPGTLHMVGKYSTLSCSPTHFILYFI